MNYAFNVCMYVHFQHIWMDQFSLFDEDDATCAL